MCGVGTDRQTDPKRISQCGCIPVHFRNRKTKFPFLFSFYSKNQHQSKGRGVGRKGTRSLFESIGVKSSRFKWVSEYKWTGMNAWMGEWTNEWANESNHWLPIYRKPNQTTKFNLSSITKCSCVLCHSWTISTHPIYGRYMMSGRKWVGRRLHTCRMWMLLNVCLDGVCGLECGWSDVWLFVTTRI